MTERSHSQGDHEEIFKRQYLGPESPVLTAERPPQTAESKRGVGRIALESISLPEAMPSIDWDSARKLARPAHEYKVRQLADRYGGFIPEVASAIAHRHDPEAKRIPVTGETIRRGNAFLDLAHGVIAFFGGGDWFDRKLVKWFGRFVDKKIDSKVKIVDHAVQRIAKIEKPKDQFVEELKAIYGRLVSGDKRSGLASTAWEVYSDGRWYGAEKFPLLAGLLPNFMRSGMDVQAKANRGKVVTPEVAKGIGTFLASKGVERDEALEAEVRKSVSRRLLERAASSKRLEKFAAPKLERVDKVTQTVIDTLEQAHKALPESGKAFADDFYELCNNITKLSASGYSGEEITKELLKGVFRKRQS